MVEQYSKRIVVCVAFVIAVACAFGLVIRFLYMPLVEKNQRESELVDSLQERISYAEFIAGDCVWYESETERLLSEAETMLQTLSFESRSAEEVYLLFLARAESETGQRQVIASWMPSETLDTFSQVTLHAQTIPFSFHATYDGMKSLLRYFSEQEEPCSIVSFQVAYQKETDTYTGVLYLRHYFLTGREEVQLPELSGVEISE